MYHLKCLNVVGVVYSFPLFSILLRTHGTIMVSKTLPILLFILLWFTQPFIKNTYTYIDTFVAIELNEIGHQLRAYRTINTHTKGCYKLNFFILYIITKLKLINMKQWNRLKLSHFSINGFEFCSSRSQTPMLVAVATTIIKNHGTH